MKGSEAAKYSKHVRHMAATKSAATRIRAGRCVGWRGRALGPVLHWKESCERYSMRGGAAKSLVERRGGNVMTDVNSYSSLRPS